MCIKIGVQMLMGTAFVDKEISQPGSLPLLSQLPQNARITN